MRCPPRIRRGSVTCTHIYLGSFVAVGVDVALADGRAARSAQEKYPEMSITKSPPDEL